MSDQDETRPEPSKFDFSAFPSDTLFYDRRSGLKAPRSARRHSARTRGRGRPPEEARTAGKRRRRVDPTTFEKQYTDDEIEFMNAVQHFKTQSGKSFPSFSDVLRVAAGLGYRKSFPSDDETDEEDVTLREAESCLPT